MSLLAFNGRSPPPCPEPPFGLASALFRCHLFSNHPPFPLVFRPSLSTPPLYFLCHGLHLLNQAPRAQNCVLMVFSLAHISSAAGTHFPPFPIDSPPPSLFRTHSLSDLRPLSRCFSLVEFFPPLFYVGCNHIWLCVFSLQPQSRILCPLALNVLEVLLFRHASHPSPNRLY